MQLTRDILIIMGGLFFSLGSLTDYAMRFANQPEGRTGKGISRLFLFQALCLLMVHIFI